MSDPHSPISRRRFLSGAAALALAGCRRPPQAGDFRGQTLTVFVYSGLDTILQQHFAEPFQQKTGATVQLDAGWWDAIGKLKASPRGQPAYDLVLTDATQGYPAIKAGLFRQIDFNQIPNHRGLAPVALDNWVVQQRYGVTFHESAMTLGWNRQQTGFDLTGWGDLMREELRGKLSLYDSFYFSLYTFACMKVAVEGHPGAAAKAISDDIGGVLDFARRERGRVRFWWPNGPRMLQDMTQGNFAAGNAHSVTLLGPGREKPEVIGFVTPEVDRAFVQLMWVIPADTPAADLAEAAIDYLLSTDVQVAMAGRGMGTSHIEAAKTAAAADPVWAATYPATEEQFRTLRYFPYEAYFKDWDRIRKVWEEEVLRHS